MSLLEVKSKGDFSDTLHHLKKLKHGDYLKRLDLYGRTGVDALAAATPKDSGITADSWSYTTEKKLNSSSITWKNSHTVGKVPLVILLRYGHATKNGGYVSGTDFISPAMEPVYNAIVDSVWEEVTKS